MKNRGFTLIELLAVIVILAIIALIATPIILNIIDNTNQQSIERSIDHYMSGVTNAIARKNLEDTTTGVNPNECLISSGGDTLNCNPGAVFGIPVEVDGNKPESGTICFENGKIVAYADIKMDGKYYTKGTGEVIERDAQAYTGMSCNDIISNINSGNNNGGNDDGDDSGDDDGNDDDGGGSKACEVITDTGTVGAPDVGDYIKCGTEGFYVIEVNGDQVQMLAEYNLKIQ